VKKLLICGAHTSRFIYVHTINYHHERIWVEADDNWNLPNNMLRNTLVLKSNSEH